jgi:hypothetical protein
MSTTRDGLEPIPPGVSQLEAIHWCLVPRDQPPPDRPAPAEARPAKAAR